MRSSLRERVEESRQRQKQLEYEKRILEAQVEAAEAAQRAKKDEIHRNFLAAQREFEEVQARKKAEIRELTRQLHENEELNRSKLQEKEQMIQEINARMDAKPEIPRKRSKKKKPATDARSVISSATVAIQAEIDQLQAAKMDLIRKMQDLQRKAASNERKLEAVRDTLERKVAETEMQVRKMRAVQDGRDLPATTLGSDDSQSFAFL
jgi:chromosome segregation ATPase